MSSRMPAPLLIVLSAPSGAGKTTVVQQLLASNRDITRVITCTTRAARPGEQDGIDYHFYDPARFAKAVDAGLFLEHATVFGNSYGTLKSEVLEKLRANKDVILTIDVQGAESIRACAGRDPELKRSLVTVFLAPTSLKVLEQRLQKRGADSPEAIQKRLSMAREEIAHWKSFDYLLISTTIEEDFRRMLCIIDAEKMRQPRMTVPDYE
ncbi:MAG TPA: guanylate kinase [Verrucomicrobiae bacterium]|nr:guanylate kinase [Verrucomicrobiae bacterium]